MDRQHYENIMDIETTENPKHESEETLLPNSKRRKIVREESDGKYDTNNSHSDFKFELYLRVMKLMSPLNIFHGQSFEN